MKTYLRKQVIYGLYAVIRTLVILLIRPRKPVEKKEVLILRLDGIGDGVLWLGFARLFRELYPSKDFSVTLLCNRSWAELARKITAFDTVLPVDTGKFRSDLSYRFRMLSSVRRKPYDEVLQTRYSRNHHLEDDLVTVCRSREKTGFAGDDSNITSKLRQRGNKRYTSLIKTNTPVRHEFHRNLFFCNYLFHRNPGLTIIPDLLPEDINEWENLHVNFFPADHLRNLVTDVTAPGGPYYMIIPGGIDPKRRWQPADFGLLAAKIHEKYHLPGVICGDNGDRAAADEIIRYAGNIPLENKCGNTTLPELVSLIARARFVTGNETGALNMAVILKTRSFCILGGGHWGRFFPYPLNIFGSPHLSSVINHFMDCYGCNWQCRFTSPGMIPFPCISSITIDQVWEMIDQHL